MSLFSGLEETLKRSAGYLPLELSSFTGGLVEEIVAPIPSPFVMAAVGSAAFSQGKKWLDLLMYAFWGALGKTLGAWCIYFLADKLEDVVVGKWGRFFGVSHAAIENIGKHFTGGWKDALAMFTLRALPIVPSSPVSFFGGVIKMNLKIFLLMTLLGNIPRNLAYIYLGFSGVSAYQSVLTGLNKAESVLQIMIFFSLLGFVGWVYYKRRQKEKLG